MLKNQLSILCRGPRTPSSPGGGASPFRGGRGNRARGGGRGGHLHAIVHFTHPRELSATTTKEPEAAAATTTAFGNEEAGQASPTRIDAMQ